MRGITKALLPVSALLLIATCANPRIVHDDLYVKNKQIKPANKFLASKPTTAYKKASFTPVELKGPGKRCIHHNNYWCVKTPKGDRWVGQTAKDPANHAIFKDATFSARAFTRIMRSYRFRHNLRTARQIISRYAPSSDCLGSQRFCPIGQPNNAPLPGLNLGYVDSRPVQYSYSRPPSNYVQGLQCAMPVLYCPKGHNNPTPYASAIAKAAGRSLDDDLQLFNEAGQVNLSTALPVFREFAKWELGASYLVSERVIKNGIALEAKTAEYPGGRQPAIPAFTYSQVVSNPVVSNPIVAQPQRTAPAPQPTVSQPTQTYYAPQPQAAPVQPVVPAPAPSPSNGQRYLAPKPQWPSQQAPLQYPSTQTYQLQQPVYSTGTNS